MWSSVIKKYSRCSPSFKLNSSALDSSLDNINNLMSDLKLLNSFDKILDASQICNQDIYHLEEQLEEMQLEESEQVEVAEFLEQIPDSARFLENSGVNMNFTEDDPYNLLGESQENEEKESKAETPPETALDATHLNMTFNDYFAHPKIESKTSLNSKLNLTSNSIQNYLNQQEFNLKYSHKKLDPNLLKSLKKVSGPLFNNQKNYVLHLYYCLVDKNEYLALKYLDDYFNNLSQSDLFENFLRTKYLLEYEQSCQHQLGSSAGQSLADKNQGQNHLPKNLSQMKNLSNEDVLYLMTKRPYRNYPIALAQMYYNFGKYKMSEQACLEARKLTEGFTDEYNLKIKFSSEIILKNLKNKVAQENLKNLNSGSQNSKFPEKIKSQDSDSLNILCPILSLKNYLIQLESELDADPKQQIKKLNLGAIFKALFFYD